MKIKNFNKIDIYFPIAGQGARFGYKFKPFLKVVGQNTLRFNIVNVNIGNALI